MKNIKFKEKRKDVIAGVLSLFLVIIVFGLYFINLFSGNLYYQHLFKDKSIITYEQTEHHSCHINVIEPTIVLRMDDVRAYSVPTPYLVDEIIDRNLSVVLGVIPCSLEKDIKIQKYLLKIRSNPKIEIAQHGTNHNEADKNITEEVLLEGSRKMQEIIGVLPVTYIPPYNEITLEAKEIVSKYFKIIAGDVGILKEGENIAEIGYDVPTYWYTKSQVVPVDHIIEKCKLSLDKTNLCVVEVHPQEYSSNINDPVDLSVKRFEDFKEMLDKLQELDTKFSTFNDLVTCSN